MRILALIALCSTVSTLAFGETARAEDLADYDPFNFSKTNKADGKYEGYRIGDHFEWTLYGEPYSKPEYGHRYEWSEPGLSRMSVCEEIAYVGGDHYRQLADDGHCPAVETIYKWDIPFEGQLSRCLKVDKRTLGQRFARIVDSRRCEKPATVFAWERNACNEIDDRTQGKVYRAPAPERMCSHTFDAVLAYGRTVPMVPRPFVAPSRKPASVAVPIELDPQYREEPEDLEDGVDHVHRSADKIHHR